MGMQGIESESNWRPGRVKTANGKGNIDANCNDAHSLVIGTCITGR